MRPDLAASKVSSPFGVGRWLPGFGLLCAFGAASGLEVQPVLAEVQSGATVASFELRNPRSSDFRLQVDALNWRQDGDSEFIEPGGELIVVPRLVNLAPGASQRVRVALRGPGARSQELSFRVLFRELPAPPDPGFTGLRTQLEISVPLFFQAQGATPADPRFRAFRHPEGGLAVAVANAGGRYYRFSALRLTQPDGALLAEGQGAHYALVGSGRHWRLTSHSVPPMGTPVRLVVTLDGREEAHELILE